MRCPDDKHYFPTVLWQQFISYHIDYIDLHNCTDDEHYFPTVLAIAGLERETDCVGLVTDANWCGIPHERVDPYSPPVWPMQGLPYPCLCLLFI